MKESEDGQEGYEKIVNNDSDLAYEYRANHFVAKPFSLAESLRLVQSILRDSKRQPYVSDA